MSPYKTAAHTLWDVGSATFVVVLALLIICHRIDEADSAGNFNSNTSCTPCNTSNCSDPTNCWQQCINACPDHFYRTIRNGSFVCETPLKTPTTTVSTTPTIVKTSTTTPPSSTTVINMATDSTEQQSNSPGRRRRDVSENNTSLIIDGTSIITESATTTLTTTLTTTVTTKTIPTTTTFPKFICKKCSVEFCNVCKDNAMYNTVCATCNDGYHLSSDLKTCIQNDDQFPAGAIAGIVVGGVCAIALVVVVVCLARRYCRSNDIDGHHMENNLDDVKIEEERELKRLGYAPAPPGDDPSKRYDRLQSPNQDEATSYTQFKTSTDSTYANVKASEIQHCKSNYANTSHDNSSSNDPPPKDKETSNNSTPSTSPDSSDFYELIDPKHVPEDTQEIYANNEYIIAAQSSIRGTDDNQEVYADDKENDVEEVYANDNENDVEEVYANDKENNVEEVYANDKENNVDEVYENA